MRTQKTVGTYMTFPQLLLESIQRSEIPLRFEPGAEEAVAKPITELLHKWLQVHMPPQPRSDFEFGQKALLARRLEELEGAIEVPQ